MRTLSDAELLSAWDRGRLEHPVDRPLALVAAACDVPVANLAATCLGGREALLMALRERTFGSSLDGVTTCPACADDLEVSFAIDDVLVPGRGDAPAAVPQQMTVGGYELHVRVPDGRDAAAAVAAVADSDHTQATVRSVLLDRCVSASDQAGTPVPAVELPAAVVDAAVACMAAADPQADVRLTITCPSCGTYWDVPFDAGSFFWSEVEAWARRTLLEVHQLATAYGWSETEVLALGPRRRQAYLELIGS